MDSGCLSVLKELGNVWVHWKGLIHTGGEKGMPFLPMPLLAVTHTVHRIKEWFVLEGILRII